MSTRAAASTHLLQYQFISRAGFGGTAHLRSRFMLHLIHSSRAYRARVIAAFLLAVPLTGTSGAPLATSFWSARSPASVTNAKRRTEPSPWRAMMEPGVLALSLVDIGAATIGHGVA
jgi:hypothetical protein